MYTPTNCSHTIETHLHTHTHICSHQIKHSLLLFCMQTYTYVCGVLHVQTQTECTFWTIYATLLPYLHCLHFQKHMLLHD